MHNNLGPSFSLLVKRREKEGDLLSCEIVCGFLAEATTGNLVLSEGLMGGDDIGTNPIFVTENRISKGLDTC